MNLSFEKIKSITTGAVFSEEKDGALYFSKCTKKQVEAWSAVEPILGTRAEATTGVRIDFYTNSKELKFSLSKGRFELYINNLLRSQFLVGSEEYPEDKEISVFLTDPLGEPLDEARITLYFPSHSQGYIKFLSIDDGAYIRRAEYDCKVLFLGDSITQGFNSVYDSFSFANQLSRTLNAESVIQGIGGATFRKDCLDEVMTDTDIIVVGYGTNDYHSLESYSAMREAVSGYLDTLLSIYGCEKKIFLISPIWRGQTDRPMGSFSVCRSIIIEEAEKRGIIHVDGLSLVPPIPSLFADEWLHPNALGFGFYGENLTRIILGHLK